MAGPSEFIPDRDRDRGSAAGRVLIVGAGIAGLATALALARAGIGSVVLEKRRERPEEGAGIQIGPNGVRVLRDLGVVPFLAPVVGVPAEIVLRSGSGGQELSRLPLGRWIAARHGEPYWVAHRADLHAALMARVGPSPLVRRIDGFEVASIEPGEDEVTAVASDGRHLSGAVLVGADGVWSRVRARVAPAAQPRPTRRSAARAVLEVGDVPWSLRGNETGVWLARGAHIVHYPVRSGREIAIVVIFDSRRADPGRTDAWHEEIEPAHIADIVGDFAPAVRSLVGAVRRWRVWQLCEMSPLASHVSGRIALVGDAAHPMLPFLAQGGVMALEDASVLATCMAGASGDPVAALAAYDRHRRPRTARVMSAARRNGHVYHLAGGAAAVRNLVIRLFGGERIIRGYDWLYGWKP